MIGNKRLYTQLVRETKANLSFLGTRMAKDENYVVAVPGRSTAIAENKRKQYCLSHVAAQAIVTTKDAAQSILDMYLKTHHHKELKVISQSDYYEAAFMRSLAILREFSTIYEE